ncbi:MAG TPA: ChaN family lipoprotein [Sedimentisphaerales bacterium]|nr:ChaN family lipoprotein [Sedimentisphaerales bacterium]
MVYRKCLAVLFVLLFVSFAVSTAEKGDEIRVPDWIQSEKALKVSQIPEDDYAYLVGWLDKNSNSPEDYVIDLFEKHQIVIFGEFHNVKEHKDFVIDLIPRLYHEAGVRSIGLEVVRHTDNQRLKELVTTPKCDREDTLQLARDQLAHEWNSKEHWDIIEAVWRLNKSLKQNQEKMQLFGLTPNFNWTEFFINTKTKPENSPEYKKAMKMGLAFDPTMAEQVEKKIIEKGQKGLVFVGRCHDFTHYEFPPEVNFGRPIMGNLLYKKYGDRVFQVWLASGWLPPFEGVMKLRGHKPAGFDLYASPFANILSPPNWDAPEVPLSKIARGYVYFGPRAKLHKNTPIKGFVTDDMFKKYKQYYEIDFGRKFKNAQEVDEHFQKHRFPKP